MQILKKEELVCFLCLYAHSKAYSGSEGTVEGTPPRPMARLGTRTLTSKGCRFKVDRAINYAPCADQADDKKEFHLELEKTESTFQSQYDFRSCPTSSSIFNTQRPTRHPRNNRCSQSRKLQVNQRPLDCARRRQGC